MNNNGKPTNKPRISLIKERKLEEDLDPYFKKRYEQNRHSKDFVKKLACKNDPHIKKQSIKKNEGRNTQEVKETIHTINEHSLSHFNRSSNTERQINTEQIKHINNPKPTAAINKDFSIKPNETSTSNFLRNNSKEIVSIKIKIKDIERNIFNEKLLNSSAPVQNKVKSKSRSASKSPPKIKALYEVIEEELRSKSKKAFGSSNRNYHTLGPDITYYGLHNKKKRIAKERELKYTAFIRELTSKKEKKESKLRPYSKINNIDLNTVATESVNIDGVYKMQLDEIFLRRMQILEAKKNIKSDTGTLNFSSSLTKIHEIEERKRIKFNDDDSDSQGDRSDDKNSSPIRLSKVHQSKVINAKRIDTGSSSDHQNLTKKHGLEIIKQSMVDEQNDSQSSLIRQINSKINNPFGVNKDKYKRVRPYDKQKTELISNNLIIQKNKMLKEILSKFKIYILCYLHRQLQHRRREYRRAKYSPNQQYCDLKFHSKQ